MLDQIDRSTTAPTVGTAAGTTTRPTDGAFPRIDPTQIPGWGIDTDPENDPTYPMRDMFQFVVVHRRAGSCRPD